MIRFSGDCVGVSRPRANLEQQGKRLLCSPAFGVLDVRDRTKYAVLDLSSGGVSKCKRQCTLHEQGIAADNMVILS